jgi:hypothetical protein
MNQKICTHPDGCQNKEPRQCLNEGCKLENGRVNPLTPDERDAEKYLQERYGTDYIPEHWIRTVVEYAAKKNRAPNDNSKKLTPEEIKRRAGEFGNTYRMKIAEGRAAYHGFIEGYGHATERAKQEVAEKDALLKKATRILSDYLTGKSSLRLFKADARIHLSKFKTTGRGAASDEE